ncbi:hypothetical protein SDJN03_28459, partial [Cucurbita argyrosperma subsp. sororia]
MPNTITYTSIATNASEHDLSNGTFVVTMQHLIDVGCLFCNTHDDPLDYEFELTPFQPNIFKFMGSFALNRSLNSLQMP